MDGQLDGVTEIVHHDFAVKDDSSAFQSRSIGSMAVGGLPLILARGLMKDVLLSIDGQDTIFHNALPGEELA